MTSIYETVSQLQSMVEELLEGFSLENTYKATLYSALRASIKARGLDYSLTKPLEQSIPSPLSALVKRRMVGRFSYLVRLLDRMLCGLRPVIVDEGSVRQVVSRLKESIHKVDYVVVYDCMSLIEFIVLSAYLKKCGLDTAFLDIVFINPLGLTKYVTQQLPVMEYRAVLREFAHMLAEQLGGRGYSKSAYIDLRVHEYGFLGVSEFIGKLDIKRIASEVFENALKGRVLVTSDHGYDVVVDEENWYLYIVHGHELPISGFTRKSILPLSRFSFFIEVSSIS